MPASKSTRRVIDALGAHGLDAEVREATGFAIGPLMQAGLRAMRPLERAYARGSARPAGAPGAARDASPKG